MTSTISSNKTKKPFLSMLLWNLKKALPVTVIYSFLLFVCYPMYVTLSKNSSGPENFDYARCQMMLIQFVPLLIGVFTIVTACVMFGIYHKKRSVDLYASLPVNKTTLFISKYVSGLLALIVPLVIFMSLGLLVSGQVSSINAFVTYYRMLGYIVSIINMYSMLAFVSMICGGTVDTLVTFGVINVAIVGCLLSASNIIASIVPGQYDLDVDIYSTFTMLLLFSFCPVAMPYMSGIFSSIYANADGNLVNYTKDEWVVAVGKALVVWFVLAIVYFVAGIIMAKKRKNENVQNGFIFNFPKFIIQAITTISAGMIIGYFLSTNYCRELDGFKTMLIFMLGALIGSVLAYLISTLIYIKGEKRYIKALPVAIGSFVAVAVFYLVVSLGLVGVSNVPKVENIKSVCVLSDDEGFSAGVAPVVHSKGNEFEVTDLYTEDKDVIKNTVALHQAIVDGLHEEAGTFFNFYDYYASVNENSNIGYIPYTIRIDYELNNGRKLSRTYVCCHYDFEKISDKYNAIVSSDTYKQECYKLAKYATAEESNVNKIEIISNSYVYSNGVTEINSSNTMNQIYSTLREEFIADKNSAETLEGKFYAYNEIVFYIDIDYTSDINSDIYQAIDRQAEKLGVIPGEFFLDPNEDFLITADNYPKTWELLNDYCNQNNTGSISLYADN